MRTPRWTILSFLLLGAACAGEGAETGNGAVATNQPAGDADCQPLQTQAPEASDQVPAFPEQTRACGVDSNVDFEVTVVASGLEHPWAVEPLPGGDLLVTEKPGRMRIVTAAGVVGEPLAGLPAVDPARQGGLLDVALSPDFESDRVIFWSYSEPRDGGNATSVARAVLSEAGTALENVEILVGEGGIVAGLPEPIADLVARHAGATQATEDLRLGDGSPQACLSLAA